MLLIFFTVVACTRDDEEAAQLFEDQIRFFTIMEMPAQKIELRAGENGYSLNTDLNETNDGVLEMQGNLENFAEGPDFKLILRYEEPVNSTSPVIAPLYYPLATPGGAVEVPLTHRVLAFAERPQGNMLYRWPQGQSLSDTLLVPAQRQLPGELFYIEMNSLDTAQCVQQVRYEMQLDSKHRADLQLRTNMARELRAEAVPRSGQIVSRRWYYNGSQLGNGQSAVVLPASQNEMDTVKLQLIFNDGVPLSITKIYRAGVPVTAPCDHNMRWQSSVVHEQRENHHQTAEVVVIDDVGTRFTSFHPHTSGWIRLGGITPFEDNEKGQSTRRFNFEGQAILFSNSGDSLVLEKVHGSLAVARP